MALNPSFLIVGGDMTRDGATHRFELEQIKADLDQLPFPYYCIPGNHEVGNKYLASSSVSIQKEYIRLYRSVFGPSAWSFTHGNVRFRGFNALLAGSGLKEESELWEWLSDQVSQSEMKYNVWIIHPALFIDDMKEPNWDVKINRNDWYFGIDEPHRSKILRIFKEAGADIVVSAHIHCRRRRVVDGIEFLNAPATSFPQWADRWPDGDATPGFLHFNVTPEKIISEFLPLSRVSNREGYGPGGNPPIEGRDYSRSREKPPLDINVERCAHNIDPSNKNIN